MTCSVCHISIMVFLRGQQAVSPLVNSLFFSASFDSFSTNVSAPTNKYPYSCSHALHHVTHMLSVHPRCLVATNDVEGTESFRPLRFRNCAIWLSRAEFLQISKHRSMIAILSVATAEYLSKVYVWAMIYMTSRSAQARHLMAILPRRPQYNWQRTFFPVFNPLSADFVMSLAFSFGSFGDIVTLIDLTTKVIQILTSTSGASESFQGLILDVTRLQHFLQQVHSFSRQRNVTILKSHLLTSDDIATAIRECSRSLERILQRVTYYRSYVETRCGKSGRHSWHRTWITSGWMLLKSREIEQFRSELVEHNTLLARILSAMSCESIQVVQQVTTQTNGYVSEVASRSLAIDANLNVALQLLHNVDLKISASLVRDWAPDGASPLRVHDWIGQLSVLPRQAVLTPNQLQQYIINRTESGLCQVNCSGDWETIDPYRSDLKNNRCWDNGCEACGIISHEWGMLQTYLKHHPHIPVSLICYHSTSKCGHHEYVDLTHATRLGWRLGSTQTVAFTDSLDYSGPLVEIGFVGA